jgi:hypothetical protein
MNSESTLKIGGKMRERSNVIEKKTDTKKERSASKGQNPEFPLSTNTPAERILSLQRDIGNQAVQKLFKGSGGWRFATGGKVQPKLTIGQQGDIYEQEADRLADEVMRMPEPHVQRECSNYSGNALIYIKPYLSLLRTITKTRNSIPHVQQYGAYVHQTLTEKWGKEIFSDEYLAVASEIALYDQSLDEGWTHPTPTTVSSFVLAGYDSPHFLDRNEARSRIESSINSANRRDFGRALHSFQDSFSHSFPPGAAYNDENNTVPEDYSDFERGLVEPARTLQHLYPNTLSGRGAALRHVVLGHYPDRFKGPGQTSRDTAMETETKRLLRRFRQRYSDRMRGLEEYHGEQIASGRPHGTMAPPTIIRRKEIAQTKAEGQTPQVISSIESKINLLKNRGQPLSKETRCFFEPRFGCDFSGVRIHKDSYANKLARCFNAKAFTNGKDIVFGAGEYSPESFKGKRLLCHELTHVLQQNTCDLKPFQVSSHSSGAEREVRNIREVVNIGNTIQLWPARRSPETLTDYIGRVRMEIGPHRTPVNISAITTVLEDLEWARTNRGQTWQDVEEFFTVYGGYPATLVSLQNGAAGLRVFLGDLAQALIRMALQNPQPNRGITHSEYRTIATRYDAHFGVQGDVDPIFGQQWRTLVSTPRTSATVNQLTPPWIAYCRSNISNVATTARGQHLMRWVLDNWGDIASTGGRLYPPMSRLGWHIYTHSSSAWFQSAGQLTIPAIQGFWRRHVFNRFNRELYSTYDLIRPIYININSLGIPSSTGTTRAARSGMLTTIHSSVTSLGQDLNNWQPLTSSLESHSDKQRIARIRHLYNTYWHHTPRRNPTHAEILAAGFISSSVLGVQRVGWVP